MVRSEPRAVLRKVGLFPPTENRATIGDMRRASLPFLVGLLFAGNAHAATLSLRADPSVARYGQNVVFAGVLEPAQPGIAVGLYAAEGSGWRLLATGTTLADGTYTLAVGARSPGAFLAIAQLDAATRVSSAPVALRMRPAVTARVSGRRSVGERLVVSGRVLPAGAGRLEITAGGKGRRVAVGPAGRFRVPLTAGLPGRLHISLALRASAGYESVAERKVVRIRAPSLALGSAGKAVHALEARLNALQYVLRGVDARYGRDTYEAVLAFQKVQRLGRTGRVGAGVWSRLARAGVPRARHPHGNHIEVFKGRQVMYEVRGGKVVNVVHVSTGATGNTPVGDWRVYRLGPGGSLSHMYYSVYFLRGFAIHGYHSVPPYPASHGCVRTPLWFAPGFYSRWGRIGTRILVYP